MPCLLVRSDSRMSPGEKWPERVPAPRPLRVVPLGIPERTECGDGPIGPPVTLVGGFLDPETGDATGRPAGVVVGADGALYVSDDKGGFIYRVAAEG